MLPQSTAQPQKEIPEEDNRSSSSRFSESSKDEKRTPNEKEILKARLEALKEKLKKAKDQKERVRIAEKQRD